MYQKVFADFFAGIGLVRMGLEYAGWNEVYSLDHDKNKKMLYDHHFGNNNYRLLDIYEEDAHAIPPITLAHASFPCTDISVAGSRKRFAVFPGEAPSPGDRNCNFLRT